MFYHAETRETALHISLNGLDHAAQLDVTVAVGPYSNSWHIFVFPNVDKGPLPTVHTATALEEICRHGGRAIVTRECFTEQIRCNFIPVFWSPVFFPSKAACGVMIDADHPALQDFPTGTTADYQWKDLLENAVGFPLPDMGEDVTPIIETVPNFYDNTPVSPLAVVRRGKAELLYCGFDLTADTPAARRLKESLRHFITADC